MTKAIICLICFCFLFTVKRCTGSLLAVEHSLPSVSYVKRRFTDIFCGHESAVMSSALIWHTLLVEWERTIDCTCSWNCEELLQSIEVSASIAANHLRTLGWPSPRIPMVFSLHVFRCEGHDTWPVDLLNFHAKDHKCRVNEVVLSSSFWILDWGLSCWVAV